MRIVFLGTPEFAVTVLKRLLSSKHEICAVVTQPDKPNGRGNKTEPSAVKAFAIENKLPLYQFAKISRDGLEQLKELNPDIMITVAYGQILSQKVLDIAKYGVINVHASLLPKYRGASPIQSVIINGEKKTGVTIMQTDIGLDSGDILEAKEIEILNDETAGELTERLAQVGSYLLIKVLEDIDNNDLHPIKQNHSDATFTKKIDKSDCYINWNKTAIQIKNLIYGANPEPIASTVVNGQILKVYTAKITDIIFNVDNLKNGEILPESSAKVGVFVKTGNGVLQLGKVQLPGGKVLSAEQLISGRKLKAGDVFEYLLTAKV